MSLGAAGDNLLWQHRDDVQARRMVRQSGLAPTAPTSPSTDSPYLHLPLGTSKPVLAVTATWPWCVPDLRAANRLDRLAHLLQHQLSAVGREFEKGETRVVVDLVQAVREVLMACATILADNHLRDEESEGYVAPGLSLRSLLRVVSFLILKATKISG